MSFDHFYWFEIYSFTGKYFLYSVFKLKLLYVNRFPV